MADGTPHPLTPPLGGEGLRLADSVGPSHHLVVRCATCEREAPCDPSPWFAEGLATLPLRSFQARIRCVCGGRLAQFEIQPGAYVRPARRDLHIFR